MKKLLLLSLATALISGVSVYANADEHKEKEQKKTGQVSKNAAPALTKIKVIANHIDSLIKANNLKPIHEKVEEAEAELSAIAKTEVKPEKKARFNASIAQVKSQLEKIHIEADKGNAKTTSSELKKLNGAIKLLESTIK